jgi:hypothetical protein
MASDREVLIEATLFPSRRLLGSNGLSPGKRDYRAQRSER